MMIYLQLLHFFNDKNLHRLKDRLAKFTQAKTIKGRDDIRKSLHHYLVGCWESAHGKYCYTLVLYYYTLTLSRSWPIFEKEDTCPDDPLLCACTFLSPEPK